MLATVRLIVDWLCDFQRQGKGSLTPDWVVAKCPHGGLWVGEGIPEKKQSVEERPRLRCGDRDGKFVRNWPYDCGAYESAVYWIDQPAGDPGQSWHSREGWKADCWQDFFFLGDLGFCLLRPSLVGWRPAYPKPSDLNVNLL